MEAVGRLAGGVAHDFNNLLTVISGRAHMLMSRLKPGEPMHRDVDLIQKTSQRAVALTSQLLAFSRKQVVQPRVLELGPLVADLVPMLQRMIGENMELTVEPVEGTGRVKVDPSQMQQVLMNLAVNARDAMPDGGRIRVSIRDVVVDEAAAAPPDQPAAGALRGPRGQRHRHRHERGDRRAHLRAVLHDQGAGQGDRARALHRVWHRRAEPRPHPGPERARPRHHVHDPPAPRGGAARRRRPARRRGAAPANHVTNGPGGGRRAGGAGAGHRDPEARRLHGARAPPTARARSRSRGATRGRSTCS